jgi:hypothetical protein
VLPEILLALCLAQYSPPSGGGGGGGAVITTNAIPKGQGTSTLLSSGVSIDSSNNLSTPGSLTVGQGSGLAGGEDWVAGTVQAVTSNSFGLGVGPTMASAHSVMLIGAPSSNISSWTYQVVPDCSTDGGHAITFTQSTDTWNCTAVTGGGGSTSPGGSAGQWQANVASSFGGMAGTSVIPQTGWTVNNCGGLCSYNDFGQNEQDFSIWDSGSLNYRFVSRTLPGATYTVIMTLDVTGSAEESNAWAGTMFLYDGTKIETFEVAGLSGSVSYTLRIATDVSVTGSPTVIAGPTNNLISHLVTLKIVNDGTHRTFSYWNAGAYTQFFQENTATFLTETSVGFGGISLTSNSQNMVSTRLKYYFASTP